MKKYIYILSLILFVTFQLFQVTTAFAQNGNKEPKQGLKVVRRVRFVGNHSIGTATLKTIVRTHSNRQLFGIPGLTPWYWLWQLTKKVGERPAVLDRETVGQDIERLDRYYESQGFLNVNVDTTVVEFRKNKYEVSFIINEGKLSRLRYILYSGMPKFKNPNKLHKFFMSSPLVRKEINDTTFLANKRFTFDAVGNERDRIISFLKNNGYASVQKDSVSVQIKRDSLHPHILDALYLIKHGSIYHFGDTYVNLIGPNNNDITYNQFDTLQGKPFTADTTKLYLKKEKGAHTKFSLLTSQILFKPGDLFNYSLYQNTVNQFQNLGMMNVRRFALSKTGGLPDYSKRYIPVLIDLQTLPKNSLSFDIFGMQRYGYGAGSGVTFTNNNVFAKAERLQVGAKGSFEYVSKKSSLTFNSKVLYNLEGSIGYSEPRLNFPFTFLENNPAFFNSRTQYQLSISHVNQDNYNINANIRLNDRFIVKHDRYTTSSLDLIDLEWIDASATPQYLAELDSTFKGNQLQKNFILEDFRPQVSTTLRYTFNRSTTDYIQRNKGYYLQWSAEVGGNVPYLVDRFISTPGVVEGSIPSYSFSNARLTYSRYAKIVIDYRRYIPITPTSVFAYRAFFGMAYPYGKTKTIPLTKRFYAGGSNDLRAWPAFRVGPGPYEDQQLVNGGEIKIEGNIEARQVLLNNFLSTKWIGAVFSDFGNVWNGPRNPIVKSRFAFNSFYKQIAVDAGFGIRLDWQYIIFRIDLAYRVHDLRKGWFKKNVMGLSFGIGQSF